MIVLLDAGPLGMVSNPNATGQNLRAHQWSRRLLENGHRVVIPEIADYEVRRELIRAEKHEGLAFLDRLRLISFEYLPITSHAMLVAARFWAESRKRHMPTSHDKALDADSILAAQAATHPDGVENTLIATTNVGHLAQFVPAKLWHEIE